MIRSMDKASYDVDVWVSDPCIMQKSWDFGTSVGYSERTWMDGSRHAAPIQSLVIYCHTYHKANGTLCHHASTGPWIKLHMLMCGFLAPALCQNKKRWHICQLFWGLEWMDPGMQLLWYKAGHTHHKANGTCQHASIGPWTNLDTLMCGFLVPVVLCQNHLILAHLQAILRSGMDGSRYTAPMI